MEVRPAALDGTARGGDDVFLDEEVGVAWFHGRSGVAEDGDEVVVGPVVRDVAEEVCAGT